MVSSRHGGERFVVPMTRNLQGALVSLDDHRLAEIGSRWAEDDEFYGTGGDHSVIALALVRLRDLVLDGRGKSEALYCWVCV
jgi:hypothetical protein